MDGVVRARRAAAGGAVRLGVQQPGGSVMHDRAMEHDFGREGWERHWRETRGSHDAVGAEAGAPNPYLPEETDRLVPATALDAGCGSGNEAIWLASRGWRVTAVDISAAALALAAARAARAGLEHPVAWLEADLVAWRPDRPFELVTTSYAHATIPQLELYRRLAGWVAPGGRLLIVGHEHGDAREHAHGPGRTPHGEIPPEAATVGLPDIVALFDDPVWEIETAARRTRASSAGGEPIELRDVVVRVRRAVA
jgi:SAM-dependent methyltransferase